MKFNYELKNFDQDSLGVICKVKNIKTGKIEDIKCKYLIACDGGKSMVREKLNIGQYLTFLLPWIYRHHMLLSIYILCLLFFLF